MAGTENAAAPFARDDAQDEDGNNTGRQAYTSGFSSILMIAIITWQAIEISKYSKTFPGAVFSGEHKKGLNDSCKSLFWVTNWSLFLTIIMVVMDGTITVLAFAPAIQRRLTALVGISKIVEGLLGVAGLVKLWVALMGIFVIIFQVKVNEVDDCGSLYNCAWWCFVGILILPIALSCCWGLFMLGFIAGRVGQDGNGDAEGAMFATGGAPTYGGATTQDQPQPASRNFTPFTGAGQRLGNDEDADSVHPSAPVFTGGANV